VIVNLLVPRLAEPLAETARMLVPVVGFGEKDAVMPGGRPDTERLTLLLNPYRGVTKKYDVCELPWPTSTVPGPESVKLGAWMPKLIVEVAVRVPDVPVTVRELVPTLAELSATNVRLLSPVVGFGEKDAVTPAGRPDIERFTLPVNPYIAFTET
jgi:hypothetical protein